MIHLPLEHTLMATFVYWLETPIAKRDSPYRALPCTLFTLVTEFGDPKKNRFINRKGKIGYYF
jgi:hypothetical protein